MAPLERYSPQVDTAPTPYEAYANTRFGTFMGPMRMGYGPYPRSGPISSPMYGIGAPSFYVASNPMLQQQVTMANPNVIGHPLLRMQNRAFMLEQMQQQQETLRMAQFLQMQQRQQAAYLRNLERQQYMFAPRSIPQSYDAGMARSLAFTQPQPTAMDIVQSAAVLRSYERSGVRMGTQGNLSALRAQMMQTQAIPTEAEYPLSPSLRRMQEDNRRMERYNDFLDRNPGYVPPSLRARSTEPIPRAAFSGGATFYRGQPVFNDPRLGYTPAEQRSTAIFPGSIDGVPEGYRTPYELAQTDWRRMSQTNYVAEFAGTGTIPPAADRIRQRLADIERQYGFMSPERFKTLMEYNRNDERELAAARRERGIMDQLRMEAAKENRPVLKSMTLSFPGIRVSSETYIEIYDLNVEKGRQNRVIIYPNNTRQLWAPTMLDTLQEMGITYRTKASLGYPDQARSVTLDFTKPGRFSVNGQQVAVGEQEEKKLTETREANDKRKALTTERISFAGSRPRSIAIRDQYGQALHEFMVKDGIQRADEGDFSVTRNRDGSYDVKFFAPGTYQLIGYEDRSGSVAHSEMFDVTADGRKISKTPERIQEVDQRTVEALKNDPDIKKLAESIKDRFGVNVLLTPVEGETLYSINILSVPEAKRAINVLRWEMEKYPEGFFQKAGLERVLLCAKVGDKTRGEFGGLYPGGNLVVVANGSSTTFHHELYHCADRSKGATIGTSFLNDGAWAREFHGGMEQYDAFTKANGWTGGDGERPQGFVRRYGATNPAEDKATIAESLFHAYAVQQLERDIAAGDTVLGRKVQAVKSFYEKLSGGAMNAAYWEKMRSAY